MPTETGKAVFRLIRFPAGLSAMTDVLAGHGLAGGELSLRLLPLAGASFLLYSAGMAFNDVFDRRRDADLRPDRPIPAGAIDPLTAGGAATALLLAGVGLAALGGRTSVALAVVVAVCVLAYDGLLKRWALTGMFGMAACRMANVALGASLVLPHAEPALWAGVAGMGLYVFGLTGTSLAEDHEVPVSLRALFVALMLGALAVVAAPGLRHPAALAALLPLAALLLASWRHLARGPAGKFVKWGVLGVMLFDAGLLLAARQWAAGAACGGLFATSLLVRRAKIS